MVFSFNLATNNLLFGLCHPTNPLSKMRKCSYWVGIHKIHKRFKTYFTFGSFYISYIHPIWGIRWWIISLTLFESALEKNWGAVVRWAVFWENNPVVFWKFLWSSLWDFLKILVKHQRVLDPLQIGSLSKHSYVWH